MKSKIICTARRMYGIYTGCHVTQSSAALSYYITITVFPFLICVSAILGSLNISEQAIFDAVGDFIPEAALSIASDFLKYVGGNKTTIMLLFGLFVMITSSAAAFRSILGTMGEIQGKARYKGIWGSVLSFAMSIVFLISVYASALVIISGEWLLQILEARFNIGAFLDWWKWVRFVALFLLLFGIIYGIYIISAPKEVKRTHRLPGALAASVFLLAVSIIFSRMISASIKYALVYGSLASFIIMMVWLNTCGQIVIMGNVFNVALRETLEGKRINGS